MEKKKSESSQRGKLISVSAESIFSKPLTEQQKADLERLRNLSDSEIDYSDIPQFTDEELTQFKRPAKRLITTRLDADVLEWLQSMGPGYSTRINGILRTVMERSR